MGHVGCQLAWQQGATEIFIWGLDYHDRKRSYDERPKEPPWDLLSIEGGWERLANDLKDFGVRLYNMNPESNLKALVKMDPDEIWRTGYGIHGEDDNLHTSQA